MIDQQGYQTAKAIDEAAIMEQARHDITAFAPLYTHYAPRIYAYCRRRVGSPQDAEDLTSLIFTRAVTALKDFRGGSVAAWLFRIAHNTVANYYRNRRDVVSIEGAALDLVDHSPQPLAYMIAAEEHATLSRVLDQLTDDQRDLLALKLGGELSSQDIGAVLGKSAGAVRVELHRLIKQLRGLYYQEEGQV